MAEHGDRHSLGLPGPRQRRSSTQGCSSWIPSHPPPASVFPRAQRGRSLPRCGELKFRTPTRHRVPNREPGRILITATEQPGIRRLRIGLPARQWRLRDARSLSRLNDFLALWPQAHMPSCNRQVTSTSIDIAEPGRLALPPPSRTAINGQIVFGSNNSDRRIRVRSVLVGLP